MEIKDVMSEFYNRAVNQFDQKLREYIKTNLKELGFDFNTDEEMNEFASNRIHRISFVDQHYHEIYLDYVDNDNKGILIGCYHDRMESSFENGKLTITFGEKNKNPLN